MRINRFVAVLILLWTPLLAAQVLSPLEMTDPAMCRLQQTYLTELKGIGDDLNHHTFPYAFYFSRKLDIDESEQKQADQRSIRFDRYNNLTTLEITGNYYASYSAERVDADHRFRQTFVDVIFPILQSAVPRFEFRNEVECFAIEVSHHVRKKVMGVNGEFPENVVVVIPRELAARVAHSRDLATQQELMLEAEAYISGQPALLWLVGDKPTVTDEHLRRASKPSIAPKVVSTESTLERQSSLPGTRMPTLVATAIPPELKSEPLHDASPQGLQKLQEQHRDALDKMTHEQNSSAHFVQYAPPAFIAFKQGAYLQLSLTSTLHAASGSQYRMAALAFDRHISHLIRPILAYFKDAPGFDGINFSTTIKDSADKENTNAEAVEFLLPIAALRRYEQYDCTGQQLLDAGIVLINGERVGLDLQTAEAR